jgi:beta-glucanase (GH16 family)
VHIAVLFLALQLVWSDDFNGPAGAPVDTTKWTSAVGGTGWGNRELEYYTNATDPSAPNYTTANAHLDGQGDLVITAMRQDVPYARCWYGACEYTSARLMTRGKFDQQYGRFEARIRIPEGRGLWPAFWMLGSDIGSVGWPRSGEIDIMEVLGDTADTLHGSIHGPGFGPRGVTRTYTLPSGALSNDFHVYAVDWHPGRIDFSIDGTTYETIVPGLLPFGGRWVFDDPAKRFYLLLNLAVGGNWPGPPDDSTPFPAEMIVNYVRVYSYSP